MCGRFSLTTPWELIKKRFDVNIPVHDYRLRYNAAPGQELWVIPEETPNDAQLFHWGLVPFWAKDPKIGTRLINARAETIAEKPAFRTPFKKHRCLVLADGFYEWDRKGARRVPYRVVLKDEKPFALAGICDYWKDESGKELRSFSIITTDSNQLIAKIHDRMPVILLPQDEKVWLDPGLDLMKALKMLRPYPADDMKMYPVSTLVNNPKNDLPQVTAIEKETTESPLLPNHPPKK
jgi:putative SOS response-associated peptidase YedK